MGFMRCIQKMQTEKGFSHEPWHFSYKPVSKPMLEAYKKLDIKSILQQEKIMGSEHFSDDFIAKYVQEHILDINPELL